MQKVTATYYLSFRSDNTPYVREVYKTLAELAEAYRVVTQQFPSLIIEASMDTMSSGGIMHTIELRPRPLEIT